MEDSDFIDIHLLILQRFSPFDYDDDDIIPVEELLWEVLQRERAEALALKNASRIIS